ncbi:GNAT family N-acetyltransferase [Longispora urticae]
MLICTPATLRAPAEVPGLAFQVVSATSPLAAVLDNLNVNTWGFDPAAPGATVEDAESFRDGLTTHRALNAVLDGRAVAAGMFLDLVAGRTELVGIATLEDFRRRGIGAAVTAALAREAFAFGAEVCFLTTDNPGALRVYERLGFAPEAA